MVNILGFGGFQLNVIGGFGMVGNRFGNLFVFGNVIGNNLFGVNGGGNNQSKWNIYYKKKYLILIFNLIYYCYVFCLFCCMMIF